MKHYIVLDEIDLSKLNNNDEVKIEVNGKAVYLCSENYFIDGVKTILLDNGGEK